MQHFAYGALGFVLALVLLSAGAYIGYKLSAHLAAAEAARAPKPETPEETERRRLIADQNAFRQLMGYSVEVAYGLTSAKEFETEDGDV